MALEYMKVWSELLKVSILRFVKLFLFKVSESIITIISLETLLMNHLNQSFEEE